MGLQLAGANVTLPLENAGIGERSSKETNEGKTIRVTNDFLFGVNNMVACVDRPHECVTDECYSQ